eukprot:TRINITY_DN199_c0_g1_i1.p1 TRINITY_DN199_c0_g1~~TRINITY_DN199_c0_g1_i1.p1  ORF type:complete len:372 (+),score=128.60 TRINITY_DN199_c0_g1_i1:73-1188(+)
MSMNLASEQTNELLYVGFNQDYGCFACATDNGFLVYNCDPLKERFRREFENGGIGIIEMLFRCNILALVGGGKNPKYPPKKVLIWDDYQNKCIAELDFRRDVKAVKLRRDRIVVVLQDRVYIYQFSDLQLLDQIETYNNPKGLCALSPSQNNTVLACPGETLGSVHIELYDSKESKTIPKAHENALSQISLNSDGTLLATTSEKGTLIRIFSTSTGDQLKELRRGADKAEIYSLVFHPQSSWLVCSSDKCTVHIYDISQVAEILEATTDSSNNNNNSNNNNSNNNNKKADNSRNRQSSLSFMKDILPSYFSSEWSFAQFRLPEGRSICCFGQDNNSVIAVCADGSYFKYTFDPNQGGDAVQEGYAPFLSND